MAVTSAAGGSNADEDCFGSLDCAGQIYGEGEPASRHISGDQICQSRLEDRHLALVELFDLGRILVDANDIMAEIGEACS